jgi:hypothetical protein
MFDLAENDPLGPGRSARENGGQKSLPERKIRQCFWPARETADLGTLGFAMVSK